MTAEQMKARAAAEPKTPQNPSPYMPTDAEANSAAETLSMLESRIEKDTVADVQRISRELGDLRIACNSVTRRIS